MSQKSILVVAMVHLFSKKTRFRPKVFSATMIVWKETEFFFFVACSARTVITFKMQKQQKGKR